MLLSEERATVRCSQRHPGSNSSAGSQAPLRRTTSYVHGSDSLPRFHWPLCSIEHVELIPFGIAGFAFCLKIATQRAEIYEHGFVSKSIYGSVSGRYSDLKSIYRVAVRRNGVLTTNIFLTVNSGQKLGISNEKFLKGDDKMELLLDRASGDLAETWAKNLDKGTEAVWLKDGDRPLLKIRKDGVLVEPKNGLPTFIPLRQFQIKNATFPGPVQILQS